MDLSERPNAQTRRHPWEVARYRFFAGVLRDMLSGEVPARVLDAGAGDGWFSQQLREELLGAADFTCWDAFYSEDDLRALQSSEGRGLSFTASRPTTPVDLILLLDVLEHVEEDEPFLNALVTENLELGGRLLFSVPAWPRLFSRHDVHLKHFRRYTPAGAAEVLRACGLRVLEGGGLFHSLMLPRALQCAIERRSSMNAPTAPDSHDLGWNKGAWVTGLIDRALALDNACSRAFARRGRDVPGLSWWALCERVQ